MAYRPGLKSDYQNLVYRLGELNILKGIFKKNANLETPSSQRVINKVKVCYCCQVTDYLESGVLLRHDVKGVFSSYLTSALASTAPSTVCSSILFVLTPPPCCL